VKFQAARDVAGMVLRLAREEKDPVRVKVLRVMAQVDNTPHVKRHAKNFDEVRKDREIQIAMP
jgi:hypothetical protein